MWTIVAYLMLIIQVGVVADNSHDKPHDAIAANDIQQQLSQMQQQMEAMQLQDKNQQLEAMQQQLEAKQQLKTMQKQLEAKNQQIGNMQQHITQKHSNMQQQIENVQQEHKELSVRCKNDSKIISNVLRRITHDSQDQHKQLNQVLGQQRLNNFITFSAYATETRSYSDRQAVQFDREVINLGSHYDPSLSVFTCPTDGYYMFSMSFLGLVDYVMHAEIVVGGTAVAGAAAASAYDSASNTVVVYCAEGSEVIVRSRGNNCLMQGHATFAYSMFSGTLLSIAQI